MYIYIYIYSLRQRIVSDSACGDYGLLHNWPVQMASGYVSEYLMTHFGYNVIIILEMQRASYIPPLGNVHRV